MDARPSATTREGRALELELNLSQRQKAGNALAVRCLFRDVTQQKLRENRLALQLAVSQIVGENASGESAGMRILEALCISQGWELGIEWLVTPSRCTWNSVPHGEFPGKERKISSSAAWA